MEAGEAAHVARAAAGDEAAFCQLYQRHVEKIHGLVYRWIGPEDAEEVTQDVFVRAWEKLDTFRGEAAFATWLYRVAVTVILGRRKRYAKERARFTDQDWDAVPARRSETSTPDQEMDLAAGLAILPDGARQILLLHDVSGFRHEEIGEMLGIAPGTSKSQLHRARVALRAYLRPED